MKVFDCDHCHQTIFFENTNCLCCGHALAYLPDVGDMAALEPAEGELWRSLAPTADGRLYRLCENYSDHGVCNWAVPADDPSPLCSSCQLTRVIPNLELPGNLDAWRRLEAAKRRLVYSLKHLKLPIANRLQDPVHGLAYDFLADGPAPALTGHDEGVITINLAEADDLEREKRRLALHEPYRTLLGHFRHEVGHYYWDVLIRGTPRIDEFRRVFGDETQDYAAALQRHYEQGPPADWLEHYVSSYSSSHPWEDWAETWAHYLHMIDSLETARDCGVSITATREGLPSLPADMSPRQDFDTMVDSWLSLTYALNNLNRSLGLPDGYPFVLHAQAIEKLRFVHEIVVQAGAGTAEAPRATTPRSTPRRRRERASVCPEPINASAGLGVNV